MGRYSHKTGAAILAALCMAGARGASAQTYTPGPWLPVTNFNAGADGGKATLKWDDFRNLAGVQVYASPTLESAEWRPLDGQALGITALGTAGGGDFFDLATVGAAIDRTDAQQFYRVRAVRGPQMSSGRLVLPDGTVIIDAADEDTILINDDGTAYVGEGDVIFVPSYAPYTVPPPGGRFVPGPPPKVVVNGEEVPLSWDGAGCYMRIDLRNGGVATFAASEPVVVEMTNNIANNNIAIEDITTNLWLRWIKPGSFAMGSPTNEYNREANEGQHKVTLTKGFWMGVFPVTQWQYNQVCGGFPAGYDALGDTYKADWKPMVFVSYDDLRGGTSSTAADAVQPGTFLHKLSALVWKNGFGRFNINFDLPTEAQWEYACRAGTTGTFNDSNVIETNDIPVGNFDRMNALGRYTGNWYDNKGGTGFTSSDLARPGCYAPNAAGLYDMHGNVYELCLDTYQENITTLPPEDPVVAVAGSLRVVRGGYWCADAQAGRSASRYGDAPTYSFMNVGFRVAGAPVLVP